MKEEEEKQQKKRGRKFNFRVISNVLMKMVLRLVVISRFLMNQIPAR